MAVKKTKSKKNGAPSSAAAMTPPRMERALASGCFEGFTPTVAKRLVAAFGSGTPEAIERWHPDAKRILGEKWDAASDEMAEHGSALPLAGWLLEQGFSGVMARKAMLWQLHESEWKHPDLALAAWRQGPHALAKIPGITFERADKIALSLGFEARGEIRVMACAQEALRLGCDRAGGGASLSDVEAQARKLLALNNAVSMRESSAMAPAAIQSAAQKGFAKAAIDENGVQMMFASDLYEAEERSAHLLLKMVGQESPMRFDGLQERIAELETQTGLTLHDEQRHALQVIFEGKVSIICGKPGSGKTTLLKCAAPLLESGGRKILYACPTGKAAKRMSKALGRRATTLHRLLSVRGGESDVNVAGMGAMAGSLKDADAVVIDESSMLDSKMFLRLLLAVGEKTSIILLGDPKQLPSVGAGKVLSDLIDSKQIPTAIMNKIVRQKEGSTIKVVARSLGDGIWMDFDDKQSDCFLLEEPNEARIAPRIAKMLARAAEAGHDPLADAQVLAAGNMGESGVKALNIALQALLNPPSPGKAEAQLRDDLLLRVGDKVMQTSNDYERVLSASAAPEEAAAAPPAWDEPMALARQGPAQAAARIKMERPLEGFDEDAHPLDAGLALAPSETAGVFNGDVGYVISISTGPYGNKIRIKFDDGIAEYDYKEAASSIVLAYACTVHKFQGSEAPLIFFVMHDNTSQMLRTRNSVYTALTRASGKCLAMGSKRAFKDAIGRDALAKRRTRLRGLLDGSIAVDHSASPEVLALSEKQGFERLVHDTAADLRLAQAESAWDEPAVDPAAEAAAKRRRARAL